MDTFYKNINVTIPYPYMKYVIGKNGNNLKKCKKKFEVDSVWFNTKRNLVEIYGIRENIDKAGFYIENLIEKVKIHNIPKNCLKEFKIPEIQHDKYTEGCLFGSLSKDKVKFLIGKNGCNFKKITRECEISFIWYNEKKHSVCIWGPDSKLENTINSIFTLINIVKNNTKTKDCFMDINMLT